MGIKNTLDNVATAVILSYNEEKNIDYCLNSIYEHMPVFVVDSGSGDYTLDICAQYNVQVATHPYKNHASQWTWALENLPIRTPWVLALDADFVITPQLLEKMKRELAKMNDEVCGIYIRHIYKFFDGQINFGGTKRHWLRLIRLGKAKPDAGDLVDFRFVVDGATRTWSEAVIEYNRNDDDSSIWHLKQDKFALRLAVEEELRRRGLHKWTGTPKIFGNTDQRFAWLRDRWLHLPLFFRSVAYFIYRYCLSGGFVDGRAGFMFHFFQGFWLRMLVDWKSLELRRLDLSDHEIIRMSETMLGVRHGSVSKVVKKTRDCSEINLD